MLMSQDWNSILYAKKLHNLEAVYIVEQEANTRSAGIACLLIMSKEKAVLSWISAMFENYTYVL